MFVVPSLSNGGAERVVSILSSELSKTKEETCVLVYWKTDFDYPVSEGVNKINLSGGDYKAYQRLSPFHRLKLIRKVIKDFKPDFIIPFLPHVCLHVSLAAIGLRCTVLQTIRNNPLESPPGKLRRWIRDLQVKTSKCTIVQNNEQLNYFPKKYRNKLQVIPNPIADDFFNKKRSSPNDKFLVVTVGRLTEQKNFSMLIRSFAEFAKCYNNVELDIYGEGELRDRLQQEIIFYEAEEQIKLCGRTNKLPAILAQSSLFVMSSNFEGMPNSLMEAMAVGIPVISTNCPTGPKELIGDNERGLLIPVNNNEELTKAFFEIYNNYSYWDNKAKEAKDFMKSNYKQNVIAEKFLCVCENIK